MDMNYLEELVNGFCDTLTIDSRVGEINQHIGRMGLRRLQLAVLALLGHFRRFVVRRIGLVPFFEPHVGWLGSLDDLLSGNILLVCGCEEFKNLNLLAGVELSS